MDNLDQTVAKLKAAADAAEQAAGAAQAYAEQLAAAGHAATGGAIDPFVFRLAIFALAVFVGYYVVWSVTPALAYAADVGDQRDFLGDRRRRPAVGRRRRRRERLGLCPSGRLYRADPCLGEHIRRLYGHRAHARDVQEEGAAK